MRVDVLENDAISLAVAPQFGARVVSLFDKRRQREWLVQGEVPAVESSVYGGEVAWGWDECFPTVAPAGGGGLGWDGDLRDHGDLWGRAWTCEVSGTAHRAEFVHERYRFFRELELSANGLVCRYHIENTGPAAFGYLYSQHMLLAARPGERIVQSGAGDLLTDGGATAGPLGACAELTPVRPANAAIATKLYAPVKGAAHAGVVGDQGTISIAIDSPALNAIGFWGCYGGWPDGQPVHQVAIEPTTAPAHALSTDSVSWLEPGQAVSWQVRVALNSDDQE